MLAAGTLVSRILLGFVFLLAGASKMRDHFGLLTVVQSFRIIPRPLLKPVVIGLPIVEMCVGTALLFGIATRLALCVLLVLLVIFTSAVALALLKHKSFDCGCFGPFYRASTSKWTIARNILLLAVTTWTLSAYNGYLSVDAWLLSAGERPSVELPDAAFAVSAVVVLGLAVLLVRQLPAMMAKLPEQQG